MSENDQNRTITYLIGGAIGLLTGLAAAYLLTKNRDANEGNLKLSSGEGMKIGMGVISLLRTITETGLK